MKRSSLLIMVGIVLSSTPLLAQYTGGIGSGYSYSNPSTGWASETTSLITANPDTIVANGTNTSTITVQLKDVGGNNLATGGDAVELLNSLGTLGSVTNNGNGTYTAILTSGTITGTATIIGTVNGISLTDEATVEFTAGTANKLEFAQEPTNTIIGAAITPAVTVQIKDINGNNVASSDVVIRMTLSYGTGTLLGTDTVLTNENGLATFSDLQIDTSGRKVLTALSDGLTSVNSDTFSIYQSVSLPLKQFWNLASVPLIQTNDSVSAVFPEASGDVVYEYAYEVGYVPITNLELGKGYWLFYPDADTVTISGGVPGDLVVNAKLGWKMIGSRNTPIDLSSLVLSGGNSISGNIAYFYVRETGYVPITVVYPGEGAWIFIVGPSAECTITLPE